MKCKWGGSKKKMLITKSSCFNCPCTFCGISSFKFVSLQQQQQQQQLYIHIHTYLTTIPYNNRF